MLFFLVCWGRNLSSRHLGCRRCTKFKQSSTDSVVINATLSRRHCLKAFRKTEHVDVGYQRGQETHPSEQNSSDLRSHRLSCKRGETTPSRSTSTCTHLGLLSVPLCSSVNSTTRTRLSDTHSDVPFHHKRLFFLLKVNTRGATPQLTL